jgi:hypothetical protein
MGGIVGYAAGTTKIYNVITTGSLSLSKDELEVWMGGIAGYMVNTARIVNARSALAISVTSGALAYATNVGGAVGYIHTGGAETDTVIKDLIARGDINVVKNNTGNIYVGGVVGYTRTGGTLDTVSYTTGTISISKGAYTGTNDVGGIGGNIADTSVKNAAYTGNINFDKNFTGTGLTHVGGLVGTYSNTEDAVPVIEDCSAKGDLLIKSKASSPAAQMLVGGLIGYISGYSDTKRATIKSSSYSNGDISFTHTTGTYHGDVFIGGAIGGSYRFGNIDKCYSSAGSVSASVGNVSASVESTSNPAIGRGGFMGGLIRSAIAGCYATAQVNYNGFGGYVGGFCGLMASQDSVAAELSMCYATGDVTVTTTSGTSYAGGLVGYTGASVSSPSPVQISNCYAQGNVLASGADMVYAGGLVGAPSDTVIAYSFAGGTVSAQSTTATACTGGVIGRVMGGSTLSSCVAIGTNIIAISSPRAIGRVTGYNTGTVTDNYALNTMRVESDILANQYNPATLDLSSSPELEKVGANKNHGANIAASAFRNPSFWSGTLVFAASNWDFSRVVSDGYPRLK